jgi:Complex I intermediate-associated protein 30 (CIA30)
MGVLATGGRAFLDDADLPFARMIGLVSTANRGGFIQMRHDLPKPLPEGTTGLRLIPRGNTKHYFVHLRSDGT